MTVSKVSRVKNLRNLPSFTYKIFGGEGVIDAPNIKIFTYLIRMV